MNNTGVTGLTAKKKDFEHARVSRNAAYFDIRDIPTTYIYIYIYLFYTSYSYNSISRYAYRGISAHIPRRDLVIFLSYFACG